MTANEIWLIVFQILFWMSKATEEIPFEIQFESVYPAPNGETLDGLKLEKNIRQKHRRMPIG